MTEGLPFQTIFSLSEDVPPAGSAPAAPSVPPGPPAPRRDGPGTALAMKADMKISDDDLRGRIVLSSDGLAVGEIERLFVDPADLRVSSLEVRLRKEAAEHIGIHRSLFHAATFEISTALVQSTGDVVILAVPLDALRPPEPPETSAPPVH